MAGRVVAIANQKGGVGKTTTAINLSFALAAAGRKTLLIDIDPQGNASSGLSLTKAQEAKTLYRALIGGSDLAEVIFKARENLDLVAAGRDLVGAEIELAGVEGRERRLETLILQIVERYDYLLIDTPPSLGLLTLAALVAARGVLVPMQCEYYALEGLSSLMQTIAKVRNALNPALELYGIVLCLDL